MVRISVTSRFDIIKIRKYIRTLIQKKNQNILSNRFKDELINDKFYFLVEFYNELMEFINSRPVLFRNYEDDNNIILDIFIINSKNKNNKSLNKVIDILINILKNSEKKYNAIYNK